MAPDKTVSVKALRKHASDVEWLCGADSSEDVAMLRATAEILEKMRTCYTEHNSQCHCGFRGARGIKP